MEIFAVLDGVRVYVAKELLISTNKAVLISYLNSEFGFCNKMFQFEKDVLNLMCGNN